MIIVLLDKKGTQLVSSSLATLLPDDEKDEIPFEGRTYKFVKEAEPGVFHYKEVGTK